MKKKSFTKFLLLTLIPGIAAVTVSISSATAGSIVYKVEASNARLIRNVTGPVIASVDGVPAEPVDSFALDGVGTEQIKGHLKYEIDPLTNTGKISAEWEDRNGHWTYQQTQFVAPAHPTGARFGSSINTIELVKDDAVTTNVYLHGDSGAAGPMIPTVFNLLATWGPAKITHNGMVFDNPFDGPVPNWAGHTMTTEKLRTTDGSVKTTSGAVYTPADSADGAVNHDALEVHLVFHDAPGPEKTGNFPPPVAFFYHVVFDDVKIKIKH